MTPRHVEDKVHDSGGRHRELAGPSLPRDIPSFILPKSQLLPFVVALKCVEHKIEAGNETTFTVPRRPSGTLGKSVVPPWPTANALLVLRRSGPPVARAFFTGRPIAAHKILYNCHASNAWQCICLILTQTTPSK